MALTVDLERWSRRVLVACIAVVVALLVLDYHLSYGALVDVGAVRRLFNTAREDGLASWFQTTQTLLAALTLWLTHALVKAGRAGRWVARAWMVLALFFTYMAVDDGAQLHERLASTLDALGGEATRSYFPSYTWQVVFLPIFGALGVFLVVFLWRQLAHARARAFLLFATTCLVLAVGLDFLEGLSVNDRMNLYAHAARSSDELRLWSFARFGASPYDTLRHFSRSLEEGLEMLAISVLWSLFIAHLATVAGEVRVHLRES